MKDTDGLMIAVRMYHDGFNTGIDEVLEIIDKLEAKEVFGDTYKAVGYQEAVDDFRESVLELKGDRE